MSFDRAEHNRRVTAAYHERRATAAWDSFRAAVARQGGLVLEPEWKGSHTPHRVQCERGHEILTRPGNVAQGHGFCRKCNVRDWRASWAEFQASVADLGGTVLETEWLGAQEPHRVLCAKGHEGKPRPTAVKQGQGLCQKCIGRIWDVFYVVHNPSTCVAKFGITSGNPKHRLRTHAGFGFTLVLRVFEDLPNGEARGLEDELKVLFRCAGVPPVQGTEYFPDAVLSSLLPFVDCWLSPEGSKSCAV